MGLDRKGVGRPCATLCAPQLALTGEIVGWDFQGGDRQSEIGNLLRNQVDPVPPFIAVERELEGTSITLIRVFESSDAPVLVRGTGALYVRDAGGKQPEGQIGP